MSAPYIFETSEYCEQCAPDGADAEGTPEVDAPIHCAECGEPLDCTLTPEGVDYVLDHMRDSLRESRESRNHIIPMLGTAEESLVYYHGSRHIEIVRDWAEVISWYNLPERDIKFVDKFLSWTSR